MTTDATFTELADAAVALGELREVARGVLARAWSPSRTRELFDRDVPVFDDGLWTTVRSLDWCDVLVSSSRGGGGASLSELCVLAEESGAAGAPVPLGVSAAAAYCEDRRVDGTPLVLLDADGHVGGQPPQVVSGVWPVVPYGAIATRLLVRGVAADGRAFIVSVDPSDEHVQRVELRPLDHGPAAALTLDEAPVVEVVAEGPAADARWEATTLVARLASVAELAGVAAAAHEGACEYAKVRVAFDRPIGAFQAVKHRLVDQRTVIEVSRALVARAAHAWQHEDPNASALTSLAAFWAIDALRSVPEGAIQIFGGIGYTWEHVAHVHLRRAACLVAGLGSRARHREQVLRWLAAGRL